MKQIRDFGSKPLLRAFRSYEPPNPPPHPPITEQMNKLAFWTDTWKNTQDLINRLDRSANKNKCSLLIKDEHLDSFCELFLSSTKILKAHIRQVFAILIVVYSSSEFLIATIVFLLFEIVLNYRKRNTVTIQFPVMHGIQMVGLFSGTYLCRTRIDRVISYQIPQQRSRLHCLGYTHFPFDSWDLNARRWVGYCA